MKLYWSPRLDPRSPDYDPEFVNRAEWEEPGPDPDGPELEPEGEQQRAVDVRGPGNSAAEAMNAQKANRA